MSWLLERNEAGENRGEGGFWAIEGGRKKMKWFGLQGIKNEEEGSIVKLILNNKILLFLYIFLTANKRKLIKSF